jgi:signal transduction histidine kinase
VRRVFLYGFGALALAGLAAGLLMSRLLVRRIDGINAAAHEIMAGDLTRRISVDRSGDEIDDLAQNLNAMLERIEQLMGGLREVSDNIAHDLKTPLTRLRSRAEAALRTGGGEDGLRDALARIIEEADELIKTFNALLLIARLEAGAVDDQMDVFDLSDVVRDVTELYEPVAEEAGLSLEAVVAGGPRVRANRQLVGQAVANLIDNAIKYGRPSSAGADGGDGPTGGGPIRVAVSETVDGVEIAVADRGPGIAPEDRARALKRFVRLERSRTRPGTGLGLSLVTAVARIHGGAVRLTEGAPGASPPGLKVVVWLPKRLYAV